MKMMYQLGTVAVGLKGAIRVKHLQGPGPQ